MTKRRKRTCRTKSRLCFERLEPKNLLASVGWDGAGQGSVELTYYLGDATAEVSQSTFESVIEQALEVWSDVVDITFTETNTPGQADSLDITFASLDGSGGVLAQAYFPDDVNRTTLAGDIQFDSSENWETGNSLGSSAFDLLYIAVHEIGHAIGLEHSDALGSVLNSTVSSSQIFTELTDSDRDAALALYAPSNTSANPQDPIDIPMEPELPIDEPAEPDAEPPESDPDDPELPSEPETPTDPESTNRWNRNWSRFRGFNPTHFWFSSPAENPLDGDLTKNDPLTTNFDSHHSRFNGRHVNSFHR